MIVYRIYDRLTGKNYIGQTARTLRDRIYGHLHNPKSLIGKAMRDCGRNNFDISVLDVCETKAEADQSERFWIDFYDAIVNGYNIMEGGTADAKYMNEIQKMKKRKRKKKDSLTGRKRLDTIPKARPLVTDLDVAKDAVTQYTILNAMGR